MVIFGLCYLVTGRTTSTTVTAAERLALPLCFFGVIAEFVAGYIFYFVVNSIWPSFYFSPVEEGKHLWLGVQGACIALCVPGAFLAAKGLGRGMESVRLYEP